MALNNTALNEAADGITVDQIRLHSGAPGAAGTDNLIADTETTISLGAAVAGVRELDNAPVEIDVPATTVSHYSLWGGGVVKAVSAFSTPETYAAPGVARITEVDLAVADGA